MKELSIGAPALPGNSDDPGELIEAINNHTAEQISESIAASHIRPASVLYNWEVWLHDRRQDFPSAESWVWFHEYTWEMLERAERRIAEAKRLLRLNAPHARKKPRQHSA